ncbi:MAG: galactose ABC transporter substrate-binding protein [Clostridia bacterium]|nr:galactose ABC transporter substrate-binding protein [Clostridia bacterium]
MKKLVAGILAAAMALTMVGSAAFAEGETYVSWYTFGDVYLTSVRTALDAAMAEKGLNVVDKDSNANQQTQTDDINTALVTGANAIVVNLVESGSIGTAETLMNAIKEKDIPAVFFNRAVSTDNDEAAALFKGYEKSAFVGTDFTQAGKMQGKMIGEYVLEHFDELDLNKDGKISYVMFKGDEANQEAIARTKYGVECADEVLTAAGKPALEFYDASNANKYLVDLNGTWSNTASFDYMQTILSQYNEANGNMVELIICNNDDMALGSVNALVNAGYNLPGGEGCTVIPVFGVDATDAAKELIANKQMTGTIKQDAEGMADAVATITANLVNGKDKFEGLNENYEIVDGWTVNIPYSVYTGE